jgi:hypothetical protein
MGDFYGGPYHPISLLKKDQYGKIGRSRLIAYHHNLHLWYEMIYIGGMGDTGVLSEVFLSGIIEIFDFFQFFISLVNTGD